MKSMNGNLGKVKGIENTNFHIDFNLCKYN